MNVGSFIIENPNVLLEISVCSVSLLLFDACSFCAVFVVVVVCGGVGGGRWGGGNIHAQKFQVRRYSREDNRVLLYKLSSADNEFTSVVLKQISSAQK